MNQETKFDIDAPFSPAEFAVLGGGRLAYVKPMSSEEISALFPQAPQLQPGLLLFALLGADGQPIILTNSREAAIANAISNELEPVSVH
jgi:hypothetical protein